MASPRTRGSTPWWTGTHRQHQGFRAHGLPRVRGDRPRRGSMYADVFVASPRTRGSTPSHDGARHHRVGFPAYAGIDPSLRRCRGPSSGLPRVRGDRPVSSQGAVGFNRASPRTRGSTLLDRAAARAHRGFPAYAGIDPLHPHDLRVEVGLPRVRGDRPWPGQAAGTLRRASRRTRGSTPREVGAPADQGGFPAYAGIDPSI